MRRLALLFAALLACGLIAAGCGDDDDNGDDSAATTESAPADTTGDIDSLDEAVETCKENVQTTLDLSEDLKSDLEEICERAGEGGEGLQEATREICTRIVEETVPEGPGRDQALDACDSSG